MPNNPKTHARRWIESLVRKHPDAGARTLARLARTQEPKLFESIEQARGIIRKVVGTNGDYDRKHNADKSLFREKRKPGQWEALLPKSAIRRKEPLKIAGKHSVLILSDIHIPQHEPEPLQAALDYGAKRKPDVIILNGDIVDQIATSEYATDPRERDFHGEISAANQLFRVLRKRFAKARIIYKWGNHEERYARYMWRRCPEFLGVPSFDFAGVFHLAEHKIELIEDRRRIELNELDVYHGHELAGRFGSPVSPALTLLRKCKNHALAGHNHQTSQASGKSSRGKVTSTFSTGCLCDLSPSFCPVNEWNHGFAFCELGATGFHLDNLRIIGGKVY